jgi:hypothetical protein
MGQENIDELKRLREEIELLKAEVSIDSALEAGEPRRMSESTTSTDSVSAEMSFEEYSRSKFRRVSDAGGAHDSIISLSAKARRSKDDLDLFVKQKQKPSMEGDRPAKVHRGAVAVDTSSRPTPSLASVRPATSIQLPRKPQMVRSGTTIDASIKSARTSRHKRTLSDEEPSGAPQSAKPRKSKKSLPLKDEERSVKDLTSSISASSSEDGLSVAGGSGLAASAAELRKGGRPLDDSSRSSSKLAKLLGSDDVKASKLLGIEVSRARLLDSPRSARSASSVDQAQIAVSPRDRTASIAQSPPATPSFDILEDIVYQRDSAGSTIIKGGTANELVRQLIETNPSVDQVSFTSSFLVTCNTFVSPNDLLMKLIDAYDSSNDAQAKRARIIEVFDVWLTLRHRDFVEEKEIYFTFARFLEQQLKPANALLADKLIAKLEDQRSLAWQRAKRRLPQSESDIPMSPSSKELLSFKHRVVANELTMIVSDLFQSIDALDLLTQHKRKPTTKEASKISLMISQFNLISNWAATEVVKQEQLPKRCKVLTQIMKVALDCFEIQNFDTATAITSGLQSAAVARLAMTWSRIQDENPKVLQRYRGLEATLSSEDNYKAYRALQSNVKPPAIPFLGVFLKDVGPSIIFDLSLQFYTNSPASTLKFSSATAILIRWRPISERKISSTSTNDKSWRT